MMIEDVSRKLHLAELSYQDWEQEAARLERAAGGAEWGGFVDGQHLVQAGELVEAIDQELTVMDTFGTQLPLAVADEVASVRSQLLGLRQRLLVLSRSMHGMT
jgi:hypothetical protein